MKIKDRSKKKAPPMEPGAYLAVCVGVVDLGEQFSEKFKSYSNKLKIIWDIPDETLEVDGEQKPRQLSKDFTFSTSKKSSLRAFLQAWNSRTYTDEEFGELDIFDQIGKGCQLQVALNETGEYSNIDTLMALPKGVQAPHTDTKRIKWDMDHWDDAVFESLPEWIQDKIKRSTQYQKIHVPKDEIKVQGGGGEECPI